MSTAIPKTTPAVGATSSHSFKGFKVPHILSWKNPQETGLLLAEILGLFIVLSSTLSLRLFLRLAFWTVGLLSSAELATRYLNGRSTGIVSSYQPSRFLPLNDSLANDVATAVSNGIRRVLYGVQHVLDARNPSTGLKLAGGFWLSYVLLGFFSLKSLVLTVIILAFALPPLYLQFKGPVDDAINQAHGHIHAHAKKVGNQVYAKAGPQIDFLKKFSGNRGGFPGKASVDPIKDFPGASARPTAYTSGATSTPGVAGSVPVDTKLKSAANLNSTFKPEDIVNKYDSVPTFQGNVPIDHQKLNDFLAKDKAAATEHTKLP